MFFWNNFKLIFRMLVIMLLSQSLFLCLEVLALTKHYSVPMQDLEQSVAIVLSQTGDWEGGRNKNRKNEESC